LVARVLLHGAVEQLETIDPDSIETVAADMSADAREQEERVLPLRSVASAISAEDPSRNFGLEQRIAELEARVEEQETALRRVLTLLVDWVESDAEPVNYRHNAA
jgi:BMFP domain-containing protein YqiC